MPPGTRGYDAAGTLVRDDEEAAVTADDGWNDPLPETGMNTGSDEGEPGDRAPYEPLAESDRAILDALRRPAPGADTPAAEERPEVAAAVRDDAPLPADGGGQDDGLAPQFREPD
jgi:hypothetical protein